VIGQAITPLADAEEATRRADVICTVTSSREPVIFGEWVKPGTHLNLVGSSMLGPVEVDSALVAKARYVADYRPGVIAQGSELAVARDAGLVDDTHVVAEIGEVLGGRIAGRENEEQITVYKSLGHVAQDLAAADYLQRRAGGN
jgi:ornithine cyclodeaminase